jgi:hypothetical protein
VHDVASYDPTRRMRMRSTATGWPLVRWNYYVIGPCRFMDGPVSFDCAEPQQCSEYRTGVHDSPLSPTREDTSYLCAIFEFGVSNDLLASLNWPS